MVPTRPLPAMTARDSRAEMPTRSFAEFARLVASPTPLNRAILSSPMQGARRRYPHDDTVMVCSSVQNWLSDKSAEYRSLHVPRHVTWGDVQHHVDVFASLGLFGPESSVAEIVQLPPRGASDLQIAGEFSKGARRLLANVPRPCLPHALLQQIQNDVEEVGPVIAQTLPSAEQVVIKLEIFAEDVCSRWHQDYYTCRAIITYNGPGTDYVQHSNVNFWEMEHCGNNECILHDKSKVYCANAGDVFLMKGKHYPGGVNGLVHKSPEKRYHADGSIMCRLCLKLDVM